MNAASRQTLAAARERLDDYADSALPTALATLADELFAVAVLLGREPALRRHLSDPSRPAQARTGLLYRLLSGKASQPTLDLLRQVVSGRWSEPPDLADAVETL